MASKFPQLSGKLIFSASLGLSKDAAITSAARRCLWGRGHRLHNDVVGVFRTLGLPAPLDEVADRIQQLQP